MGRITVFASDDVHSQVAMIALQKLQLPYTVISLSENPSKRAELHKLTSTASSPQVFFNTRHVGGLWEVVQELQNWRSKSMSPTQRYERHISVVADPTNKVFNVPKWPEVERNMTTVRYKEILCVDLPDRTTTSIGDMMEKLRNSIPKSVIKFKGNYYRNAFGGSTLVKTIKSSLGLGEAEAVVFCQKLQDWQVVVNLDGTRTFEVSDASADDETSFYRLYCDQKPWLLNSFVLWNDEPRMPMTKLLVELDKMMYAVETGCLSKDGYIDYSEALKHKQFHKFEYAICELQVLKLEGMDRAEKISACLNIAVLMLKYAFLKLGVATSEQLWRNVFWKSVKFTVGGDVHTFQTWTDKILRPLAKNDYRAVLAMHLGAHMGGTVSTPFRLYTSAALNDELNIAAQTFFEDKSNLSVNSRTNTVRVSRVINWYKSDFGKRDASVFDVLSEYTQGSIKLALDSVLNKGAKLAFLDVDLTRNTRNYALFEETTVQGDVKGFRKVLTRFQPPRTPPNEQLRVETLRGLNILDSLAEERFDRITSMAKHHFDVPLVFISLIDHDRQWFKSKQWSCPVPEASETGRDISFCGHAILLKSEDIFHIPDATKDYRFADNPLVTGPLNIRFYAGYAISVRADTGEEVNIGTLCIIDQKPRDFSEEDKEKLRQFGRQVKEEIIKRDELPISFFSPSTPILRQ